MYLKKFNGAKAPPLWGKGGIFTAERRMFSKTIIDSDLFLDMPQSTQLLYFHLSMRADDDGFINNPKKIMRMVNCSEDDMKILITKQFIIPFESGIVVIKHWRIHNYIQKDRFKPTMYEEEKSHIVEKGGIYNLATIPSVSEMDTTCIQSGYKLDTQDRLGEDRLSKDRSDKEIATDVAEEAVKVPYQEIMELFNGICVSFPKVTKMTEKRKKAVKARFNNGYTLEDFKRAFEIAEKSDFLKGNNDRSWRADFDWLTNENNLAKTLEGKYNNKGGVNNNEGIQDKWNTFI